jgi:hypothetical protein
MENCGSLSRGTELPRAGGMNGEPSPDTGLPGRATRHEQQNHRTSHASHAVLAALTRGSGECVPPVAIDSRSDGEDRSDQRDKLRHTVSRTGGVPTLNGRTDHESSVNQFVPDRHLRMDASRVMHDQQRSDDGKYDSHGREPDDTSEGGRRKHDHICDFVCVERGDHDAVSDRCDVRASGLISRRLPPRDWHRLKGTLLGDVWPSLNTRRDRVMVVERDGDIVGCMVFAQVWHAECVWVHPKERGRVSVGRKLIRMFRDTARSIGASEVVMMAMDAVSRRLCSRLGDTSTHLDCDHYAVSVERE